jgi:hypothetical protein
MKEFDIYGLRVQPKALQALKKVAEQKAEPMSVIIRRLINEYLEREGAVVEETKAVTRKKTA